MSSSSSSSSPSPPPRRPGRPTIYSPSEKKRRRKSLERKRAQSRICIREQIGRWMSLRETLNVFSHAEVAKFLLDLYDSYENQDVVCKESEGKIQEVDGNTTLNIEEDVPETSLTASTERLPCEDLEHESTDNSGEECTIDNDYDLSKSFSSVKHLKNVSIAEDILGITDECDDGSQGDFTETFEETTLDMTLDETQNIAHEKIHIIYEHSLLQLAKKIVIPKCLFCAGEVDISIQPVSSCVHLIWKCSAGHIAFEWSSQPLIKGQTYAGDLALSAAIILSGNNFGKISQMANFMKLTFVSASTFFKMQRHFIVPTIESFWCRMKQHILEELHGKEVVIMGDGHMDGPGHSAQYCVYSFMDLETKQILAIEIVDKRKTQLNSPFMEKEAFRRGLQKLLDEQLMVKEVVTDSHTQISALITKKFPCVIHSYDIWGGAKNLGNKLIEGMWCGLVHHVVNEHQWASGNGIIKERCKHGPQMDEREKEWLEKGSKPHTEMCRIILDKKFLRNIPYFLQFRSTFDLEQFQQHVHMYATKRFEYTYPVYRARCFLAAIDYNMHLNRQTMHNQQNQLIYRRIYHRKSGRWTLVPKKENKHYVYIDDIMEEIFQRHLGI
ncbi:uncharacterized protein LOC102457766 isoform X2 [Pelodiscus sinensis]|uniref:uncharacterized protein LOC102457766 isoform X2 n=1 Tax=Pelodiscus sinensis TaxID=13735 RepID=UPI0003C4682F|nr:uncharacterized protein LOC102457766 isoform X2 [Pelodiscus sinensis]|eukprot:XP_006137905.1 uncharacterized protein LOC102457766 isoform X2 [Pelodiscus sinensis]